MFEPDLSLEKAFKFSRFDEADLLSTVSPHPIELEEETWKSAEHYLQAHLVASESRRAKIKAAKTPQLAFKMGSAWYRPKKRDWKKHRRVLMTRALYTKVQMYSSVKEALLATGEQLIVETSAYDYYWGIGRDQRGENMLGKVWMDIRQKLKDGSGVKPG